MIETLVDREDKIKQNIEDIKQSGLPVLLYGTGLSAESVFEFLRRNGVNVAGVFAGDEYCRPGARFHGFDVMPRSRLGVMADELGEFIVFVAFYCSPDWTELVSTLSDIRGVKKVSTVDLDYAVRGSVAPIDYECVRANRSAFDETYRMFADDASRDCLTAYLNMKITHCCEPLMNRVSYDRYFPKSFPFPVGKDETFVDCGAFDGDTVLEFCRETSGQYRRIFCFEPNESNAAKLKTTAREYDLHDVEVIEVAAWNRQETLAFEGSGLCYAVREDEKEGSTGTTSVKADSIDNLLGNEPVSFIKMDIEGSELQALRGAERTIVEKRPKLAICAYHKECDLIDIPRYIRGLLPDAKLYFRLHTYTSYDHVLYAIS